MSAFPGMYGWGRFHLSVRVVEGVIVEIRLVFLYAYLDRSLSLANVEGRAITTRNAVNGVGSTIGRRRGFGLGEEVP